LITKVENSVTHEEIYTVNADRLDRLGQSIVAIRYGRGFLIHSGISLDEEREYKILLDIIRKLSVNGYKTLANPYDRIRAR
jgi:hypothetical protein